MNIKDYEILAQEYLSQATVISEKIAKKRLIKDYETIDDRKLAERVITDLYQMHRECLETYKQILLQIKSMKEHNYK